jgi:hypothetical protein
MLLTCGTSGVPKQRFDVRRSIGPNRAKHCLPGLQRRPTRVLEGPPVARDCADTTGYVGSSFSCEAARWLDCLDFGEAAGLATVFRQRWERQQGSIRRPCRTTSTSGMAECWTLDQMC